MKAEWWIDGPPDAFQVGMLVKVYDSEWTGVVVWISADGDPEVVLSEDHTESLMYAKKQITAHCPMMPRREAEEMSKEYAMYYRRQKMMRAEPLSVAEWRERRAGDAVDHQDR